MKEFKKWFKCAGIRAIKTMAQTAVAMIPVRNKHNRSRVVSSDRNIITSRNIKFINKCSWTTRSGGIMMEDNIVIEEVEFNEELYQKNIEENTFEIEYEGGEE